MLKLGSCVIKGLAPLLVLISLFLGAPAHSSDYEEVYRLRREGKILSLSAIIARARAIHRGQLLEAEIERSHGRYIYEIEIGGDDGRFYELYFDAATGKLLKSEHED